MPLAFKRRGLKKVVVGPTGVEEPVRVSEPAPIPPPHPDPVVLRTLGRGLYWQHLLEAGAMADAAELAAREGLHRTFVNDHLRLALLAPDLVEAALQGALPRTVTLLSLLRDGIPVCWQAQRSRIFG